MAPPSITAGQLRERVRVQRRPNTSDGMGGTVDTWRTLVSDIPAKIGPTRGGEEVRANRLSGISHFDVWIRSDSTTRGITTADRLVDQRSGRTFNILWIGNLDEKNRFLTLTCESGGVLDG
ncbi:head-tail adaptor protein [Phenylobacterium terrae]|uniref:Head-tail adaptor protein n=1 Tax=Phenylobacterium terrae TaxID=2665495 RepID=A0ABW4N6L9_9CAUL